MRSLWLLFIYISFLALGTTAPFVASLGYVWVDSFRPQEVAYIILNHLPVAMIMGVAAFLTYFGLDRRAPPPISTIGVLQVVMPLWCTLTMLWAVAPDQGWEKWDWAFKTMAFSAFVPFVIRSRVQIEAFAQTYLFALAANFVPFGLKTLISGGGYGRNLGLGQGNSGLAEGGFLSTACLMAVPLALFLARHAQLVPRTWFTPLAYWGIALLAVATAIGTYQRSALIGLAASGVFMILTARRKLPMLLLGAIAAAVILWSTSDQWTARISTIAEYQQESSAYTRILVWKWTLDFASTHPAGGGFMSYLLSHIEYPPDAENPGGRTVFGRAFHSIYFEVLGEQGYPGLLMFLAIALGTLWRLHRLSRRLRGIPELAWCRDMAIAVQSGLVTFLAAGAFVAIAFQPMFWYFVALGVCLTAYVRRAERLAHAPAAGWRTAAQTVEPRGPAAGWRPKPVAGTALHRRP